MRKFNRQWCYTTYDTVPKCGKAHRLHLGATVSDTPWSRTSSLWVILPHNIPGLWKVMFTVSATPVPPGSMGLISQVLLIITSPRGA